jgi:hypothetical protein
MTRTIGQLMADFDTLLDGGKDLAGTTKVASAEDQDDDPVKLAERLVRASHRVEREKLASPVEPESLLFKVAESLAITDTLLNLETFAQVAELEKKAREAGHSDEQIEAFLEKSASALPLVSVINSMSWLKPA